ncbi:hypothetical protein NIES4071_80250 [Calothrix sp. NIES-4071]|nr:hypothetical protein NIES4071_80250 [Calothrix sp. NIES-4071]BAZ62295.1 hypothetical protein NIES4105_80180 [Calothrix sp. NIES-4105]
MKKRKSIENISRSAGAKSNSSSLQLALYMIPVVGFFPSLWTLYSRHSTREQLTASKLSITLMLTWILGYLLLATGAEQTSNLLALRLLILNTFLTSGYFLVSVWLVLRTIRGTRKRLPGFNKLSEQILSKYTR